MHQVQRHSHGYFTIMFKTQQEAETSNYARQYAVNFRTARTMVYKTERAQLARKDEQRSPTPQINLSSTHENQPSKRASYVALTKGSNENRSNSSPTSPVQLSNQLPHYTFPKVIGPALKDSIQGNSPEKNTPPV